LHPRQLPVISAVNLQLLVAIRVSLIGALPTLYQWTGRLGQDPSGVCDALEQWRHT